MHKVSTVLGVFTVNTVFLEIDPNQIYYVILTMLRNYIKELLK